MASAGRADPRCARFLPPPGNAGGFPRDGGGVQAWMIDPGLPA